VARDHDEHNALRERIPKGVVSVFASGGGRGAQHLVLRPLSRAFDGRPQRGQPVTDVMPEREIWKPLPLVMVQVTPAVVDSQRNGPTPVSVP
jgi:hypothetical protein